MNRLALNFICKNEAHVIDRMLQSALPITDMIVAVDTGSTDDTIEKINLFGQQKNIPTYVFERPFDNFCNSRNYALEKLKEMAAFHGWDMNQVWGFRIDCDETLEIIAQFDKEKIDFDICHAPLVIHTGQYSRQLMYRLSNDITWEGPIHEYIKYDEKCLITANIQDIIVTHNGDGASWGKDVVAKYVKYANILEDYVSNGNADARWTFYIGESYAQAAEASQNEKEKQELLEKAIKAYEQATKLKKRTKHEEYRLYYSLADTKFKLNCPGNDVRDTFLKAYSLYPAHGEPIKKIIQLYANTGRWQIAYLFAVFALEHFTGKHNQQATLSNLDLSFYRWKTLFWHASASLKTNRKDKYIASMIALESLFKARPDYFSDHEIKVIDQLRENSPIAIPGKPKRD